LKPVFNWYASFDMLILRRKLKLAKEGGSLQYLWIWLWLV